MKIDVIENENTNETIVTILCRKRNSYINKLIDNLFQIDITLSVKINNEYIEVPINDIYYIETIDRRTYIYCEKEIYENTMKIYEIEKSLLGTSFIRINKASLLNTDKLQSVKGQINGRLLATLLNGEKIIVNRHYVSNLKYKLQNNLK